MPVARTHIRQAIAMWRTNVPTGDRQMALNRFLAGVIVLVFNIMAAPRHVPAGLQLYLPLTYILTGWLAALYMSISPKPLASTRVALLALDCGALSLEMHIGGGAAAWLFSAYLWTISGYGYRFGSRFQLYAMSVSTSGFCMMAAATPFWRDQPALWSGGVICLTAVPLYAIALIKSLSKAQQQAEEANKAKSLFLTSVSHELRTPLNAVIGMGALLERSALTAEQLQMSQTIMTAARSLLSLINGILDMSRIESGQLEAVCSDFDLALLLAELRSIFAAQERLKGVVFNVHVTARTPRLLHGDVRKLHEILLNLIGNAIKFTDNGSVTVMADMVARRDEQVRLRFEVTDTGIGIAPAAHERIFEIFTQADGSIVNRFGGTGLGLALVRKSVELLGGEIGVQSSPGSGSTFWFELPMQSQPAMEKTSTFAQLQALVFTEHAGIVAPILGRLTEFGVQIKQVPALLPGWPAAANSRSLCLLAFRRIGAHGGFSFIDIRRGAEEGLRDAEARLRYAALMYLAVSDAELVNLLGLVAAAAERDRGQAELPRLPASPHCFHLLVADDNATNRYVTEKILSSAGHMVTLVNNGEEALDALAEKHFDAAILDVNMPFVDGIDVTKIYRMTVAGGVAIPLIALTADATPATRERCLDAGMAACLVKPVEPARLLAVIDEVIPKAGDGKMRQEGDAVAPRITEIAAHPRFRGAQLPALDAEALARLRDLGGEAFLIEVCDLFRGEAHAAVQELRAAAAQGDVAGFRAHAHALRSVAANIGARQLYEICKAAETISASQLGRNGHAWLEQVAAELARIEARLADYHSGSSARA